MSCPPDFADKLKPEFVAPLVLYLCSEPCADSGLILNAGMGFYSRAAVVSGPGAWLAEEGVLPSIGDVHRNWSRIHEIGGAQEYTDANVALMDMLTGDRVSNSGSPTAEARAPAADPAGDVGMFFAGLAQRFQASSAGGVSVVFQFSISGPGGGDWTVSVDNGECQVGKGSHASPTTTLEMSAGDFLEFVGGRLPAMQAYTSGRLNIRGDLMKSQLVEKLFKFD